MRRASAARAATSSGVRAAGGRRRGLVGRAAAPRQRAAERAAQAAERADWAYGCTLRRAGDGSGGDSIYGGKFNGARAVGGGLPRLGGRATCAVCRPPPRPRRAVTSSAQACALGRLASCRPPSPRCVCCPGSRLGPDEKAGLAKKHDAVGVLSMANSGKNSNTRCAGGMPATRTLLWLHTLLFATHAHARARPPR